MGGGIDTRPWLILSRREVEALIAGRDQANEADYERALKVAHLQFKLIDSRQPLPTRNDAIEHAELRDSRP